MSTLRECTLDDLLREIVRRFEDGEATDREITSELVNCLDYDDPQIIAGVRDAEWSDEQLLGSDRYEELTRHTDLASVVLPVLQQLARPAGVGDYEHARAEAERLLLEYAIYGQYETQARASL